MRVEVDQHGNPARIGNSAVWTYEEYLRRHRPGVEDAMLLNRLSYSLCEVVVLVLPSGCDSHFDVGMAVASGAKLVVYGTPNHGDRMPVHLAASEFADEGVVPAEDLGVLRVRPLSEIGTPVEIVTRFGGKDGYITAVHELEDALYTPAA